METTRFIDEVMHSLLEQQRQVTAMRQQGKKKTAQRLWRRRIWISDQSRNSQLAWIQGYSLLGEPMPRPRYHIDLQRKRQTMDVSPGSERYFKMHKVKFGGLPDPLHLFRLSYFRPGIYMATLTLHVLFLIRQKTIPQICGTVSEIVKWTYPSPVAWLAICGFYHHYSPTSVMCC